MSILSITSGMYVNAKPIVQTLADRLELKIIPDSEIIVETAKRHGIKQSVLEQVASSRQIPFNDFTREKEKGLACLKKTVAEYTAGGRGIFHGLMGHLIPDSVSHVMRVLLITDKKTRLQNGMAALGLSQKAAAKNMAWSDRVAFLWTHTTSGKKTWDRSLYDIVLPTDKQGARESVDLVHGYMQRLSVIAGAVVEQENRDFDLAAAVEIVLAGAGSGLYAAVQEGNVVVTIDHPVMMLSKFKQKIMKLTNQVPGVKSVETRIGPNYYKSSKTHRYSYETPMRILLVDDEKEFVQTLSERLKMRQLVSEVAFSGEEALDFTSREETDVMVLDLKMPGVDGFEVLKRIKGSKPNMEVIILTGHGSEADKEMCMKLGAFAYLQKPADIDLLSDTMKRAYEKISLEGARSQPVR